ncbi:alpha/beta fold hydrolase [Stackebrandtia soli]|uniref:alpha/beta fold hydrolase n=1 Tax=Stackebrandtia soli TaxID=1892856 RepID=UPI0039E94FA3
MRIRPATADDVDFLTDVVVIATRDQGRWDPDIDEAAFRRGFSHWTSQLILNGGHGNSISVIEVDGLRAGRLRVERGRGRLDLAGLQLLPEFQSNGVGTAIINELKREAASAGIPMTLGVESDNPRAEALYQRLGFRYIDVRDDDRELGWNAAPGRHPVEARDGNVLSVHIGGDATAATTVLQLSGGPGCVNYLADLAEGAPVRVISPDPRGVGGSDGRLFGIDPSIEDLEDLRRWLGIDRWTVVGHSFGADLAVIYALRHPEAVTGVIAACGTGIQNDRDWKAAYDAAKDVEAPIVAFDPLVHRVMLEDWRELIKGPTLLRELATMDTPVRFVLAERDIRPSWPIEQLAALIPGATLDVVPEAPHEFWHSHPDRWRALLRSTAAAAPIIPRQRQRKRTAKL